MIERWEQSFSAQSIYSHTLEGFSLKPSGAYSYARQAFPEMAGIVQRTETLVNYDITDIECLSALDEDIPHYDTLDEFIETERPLFVADISDEALVRHLRWSEVRITDPGRGDFLQRWDWDGRLTLSNAGGTHHLAAARFIAARLQRSVPLRSRLIRHTLSEDALLSLTSRFSLWAINISLRATEAAVRDELRRQRTAYFTFSMPIPYRQAVGLLIPHTAARQDMTRSTLAALGAMDVGSHLEALLLRQNCRLNPDA